MQVLARADSTDNMLLLLLLLLRADVSSVESTIRCLAVNSLRTITVLVL